MFKKIKFDMSLLITSIFFGSLILFVLPIFDNSITSFSDRVIGNATLFRIDVSKRLKNIYFLDIILIPILTILINMFLSKLLKNTRKNVLKTINTISIFGIISVIMEFINVTANSNSIVFSSYILCGINLIIIAFSSLSNKEKVPFQDIKWCFMAAIPFAFFATLIMHRLNILIKTEIINWIFAYFFSVLIIILIISKLKKLNMGALKKSYILFLSAPLFEYIYLELYNILNQYNIFLNHKLISIAMIYIVLFI